ncbi:hypothetical protein [Streptomyces sp. NPDC001781]
MAKREPELEPEAPPSRLAGGCVLALLAAVALAALFAVDEAVGVLVVVVAGTFALWRSARRVSDSSAPPPPEAGRPSCRECAGHELVSATPSRSEKGMWIYATATPDRPNHTHIHVGPPSDETPA